MGSTRTLLTDAQGGLVRRTVLPGGLRVVTEAMPTVRSASFGIWVGVGSRDETTTQAGASHYLEHLLFKGTPTRSAMEISAAIESRGGEMNAFTAKEYTCFYARVLDADLPIAIDVVSDMVTSSLIRTADVDVRARRDPRRDRDARRRPLRPRPRRVRADDVRRHPPRPSDPRHRRVDQRAEPSHHPRLLVAPVPPREHGHRGRRQRRPRHRRARGPQGVQAPRACSTTTGVLPEAPRAGAARTRSSPAALRLVEQETEQANIVLGVPGVARDDDRRFALGVLNAALGGGMSARLFQEVREKRGLAYSVYSYVAHYADTGVLGVYAGCLPHKVDQVLDLVPHRARQACAATASPPTSSSAARASCAAGWCSAWRTPVRG